MPSTPGAVSKQLANEIRARIEDLAKARIKTDAPLFQLMAKYQSEWMFKYKTTTKIQQVSVIVGTTSYTPDPQIFKIIRWYIDETAFPDTHCSGYFDELANKIIIKSDIKAPYTIQVQGYIKPVYGTDKIDSAHDPIIQGDFFELLKDAVITHYPAKNMEYRVDKMEDILRSVNTTANELRLKNRTSVNGNLTIMGYN